MSLEFLVTALVVVLLPGTGVIFTLSAALTRGFRASLLAAFGCTLGILPHMAAAITGLAALLHASAVAFEVIRYAGVVYLLIMAWKTVRETGALGMSARQSESSSSRIILSAILVNILNPKLSVFFLAFLPQFIATDASHPLLQMVELGVVFMAMTFAVFALYGAFAASVRSHVTSRPSVMTWLRRSFAAAFVGLSFKLMLAER
ncbi:LysE family translocator [Consotaella salsifontis]|uniref:Threonine/homoserine/homoserine lactone efflux protein n=1 Tax=Consotaella salsifontis TaxID=1365950 RepID=A0A1T4NXY7_9HYPH|nr:LysE family translocator [Consotaella salsifontis]SJZ83648.1 Threonine/homoserine/homoserine lactone efflux protein [Consotaella salsifontis]